MSQTLLRPPPVLFMPQKQPAKPMTRRLKVVSEYEPAGDQPTAIKELVRGVQAEDRDQVLARIKDAFDEEWDNPTDLDPEADEA